MATAASSPKQGLLQIIQGMPDDSSYEEILHEIVIARMVDRGLADVDAGRSNSDEETRSAIESWRDE
jgi:hypothetical protein